MVTQTKLKLSIHFLSFLLFYFISFIHLFIDLILSFFVCVCAGVGGAYLLFCGNISILCFLIAFLIQFLSVTKSQRSDVESMEDSPANMGNST